MDSTLKRDMGMAFQARFRGGRVRALGRGGGGERRRGTEDNDSQQSSIQVSRPSVQAMPPGNYFIGTGCLIFSQAAAKSKAIPWGFSWQVMHWALMASGLP